MPTAYGNWHDFCRDSGNLHSTIPVCNLFNESPARGGSGFDSTTCSLQGIPLKGGEHLANLGSILLSGIAIVVAAFLIWRSNLKRAAVGRREMQLFLLGYIFISLCEIFTVGWFPLKGSVRRGFSAAHIALVVSTLWVLMLNAAVGFQLIEDGTPLSTGLLTFSSLIIFIGTGYIALDTGFSWTGFFDSTLTAPNRSYSLYTLYQLVPLIFLFIFFCLETYLVLRILGERKPMIYLIAAAIVFAIGQIFQYLVSVHICNGTNGKINGGLFEVLFTLCAVVLVWVFWSSITEDDWPTPAGGTYT